jgi:GGDEF domain-containing protein
MSLRKEKEDQLTYNADHDALTGLFNRRYFNKSMQYLMDYLVENAKEPLSFYLAYIDFDDFKKVNDTYGHDVGDLLLVEVAKRLNATLKGRSFLLPEEFDKPHDECKNEAIFRMGGDEFTTVLADISKEEMSQIAAELVNQVKAPYLIEGQNVHITCSIGISHYPEQADNAESLLKNADTAMYHAKLVKSMYCYYIDSM